ncbi:hypothetical protein HaLaN_00225 [Haematococcus lacustris]|uniref:Uncharacterized protein n=1 Tax=Haematococcus lacustris TaxID=44745 RepID=A0A699Y8W2_HAELA|nr:hypothetical protein HaLaN_00225 [Haematococcus lacustris]
MATGATGRQFSRTNSSTHLWARPSSHTRLTAVTMYAIITCFPARVGARNTVKFCRLCPILTASGVSREYCNLQGSPRMAPKLSPAHARLRHKRQPCPLA